MKAPSHAKFRAAVRESYLPFNIEVEQALLGAVLVQNDAWHNIVGIIEARDFYDPLHARIFEAISTNIGDRGNVTPLTLRPLFEEEDDVGDITAPQYLGRLAANATTVINAPSYASGIRDLSDRRDLIVTGEHFLEQVSDANNDVTQASTELISHLDDLLSSGGNSTRQSLGDAALAAVDILDDDKEPQHVPTGLTTLDDALGGYYRGEYVVLSSRPGMGKSLFASSTLMRLAMKGRGVHYISLEMTREQLAQRCVSDLVYNQHTPIPYMDMRRRAVDDYARERLRSAAQRLKDSSMVIEDAPGLTVPEIAARARAQQQRFQRQGKRLDILCIDHIGKVKPSGKYQGNKVNEVGEISGALANLAKDLGCTVMALSQLNRGVESQDRKNKRPMLSDLRSSGDIEQDADVVLFLFRAAYYLEKAKFDDYEKEKDRLEKLEATKNKLEIIISKQRAGPCRTVRAFVDMGSNVVRDLA